MPFLSLDMASANAWIASGGRGVTIDRLEMIMTRYTKMYGNAVKKRNKKGKSPLGKQDKKAGGAKRKDRRAVKTRD